jgi:phosphoribosylamine--glycine ligase
MKILVIGGGGREHALVWKLKQSPRVTQLFCAPGNAGIAADAECVAIGVNEIDKLAAFAKDKQIELTVVGPEAPLCAGVVDLFQRHGLKIFGPQQRAARLEGSKVFCKEILLKSRVPTGHAEIFDHADQARAYLKKVGAPIVVKADGLAAGKGVIVAPTVAQAERAVAEIMEQKVFGAAGDRVVIEECLVGEEASVMALVDGKHFAVLAPSQDHKRIGDNDTGPNTGGMGAYSPTPAVPAGMQDVLDNIFRRTIDGLAREGIEFRGVLYAGLMLTQQGPKVLEFNARFGDPETQAVLPRMDFDLAEALERTADGELAGFEMNWKRDAAVCVVLASGGYPGAYAKGKPIAGLKAAAALDNVAVFHAGTARDAAGQIVTDGGRVLGVTALGADIAGAVKQAYRAVEQISFAGAQYRRDIAARALARRA